MGVSRAREPRITTENLAESLVVPPAHCTGAIGMKVTLHRIECDEGDLLDLPETWIPVRLEPNGYANPTRKSYTLYYLQRA